jgi:hypothetical protein
MKLGQVLPARETLKHLAQCRNLAAVTSLRLARYWRVIGPELDAYEAERVRLVHELGDRDGDEVRVRPENNAEFRQQIDAMLEEEIELAVKPFDLLDFQKAGLSAEDIYVLETAGLLTVDWDAIDAEEK